MFKNIMENVKNNKPLVHNITNYVTVNDCANILLACGASPIMSDEVTEVEEITSICTSLNINVGTLNSRTVEAMLLAGEKAYRMNHPVVLDPVGVGASECRNKATFNLLERVQFNVIKGNISEVKTILNKKGETSGVDAKEEELVSEDDLSFALDLARKVSFLTKAIVVITGEIDIISTSNKTYICRNGHALMTKVTGTGCMLSSLIAAYIGANQNNMLDATLTAVCLMGVAGEVAYEMLDENEGSSTYKTRLIDSIHNINYECLEKRAKYEVY